MARKVYVDVTVHYNQAGEARPLTIEWEDGRVFAVDRLLDVRRAASLRTGGSGMRYKCRIYGQERFLYEDQNRWYIEKD